MTKDEEIQLLKERTKGLEQAEEKIKHLNLVLRAIRNVNQLITKEKDRDKLIKGACENLIETRGYFNAWITLLDNSGKYLNYAEAGLGKDILPMIEMLKSGKITVCGKKALKKSDIVITKTPPDECKDCPLSGKYANRGGMTIRLEYEGKVYGIMSASISKEFIKDDEEHSLFKEVADDIAFALYSIEVEKERKQSENLLKERVKELQCLYGIAEIFERPEIALEKLYQETVYLLPPSWQYPEITGGCITIEGKVYKTDNFKKTKWLQREDIYVKNKLVGAVEVCYLKEKPDVDEGPFHKWERDLIKAIARQLGDITEHKEAEEKLRIKEFAFNSTLSADSIGSNEGFLTHANPAFARVLGYENADEVIGKPILDFLADKDKAIEIIESINNTGKWEGEYTALRKDGSTFIARSSANAVYDKDGKQTALYSSVVDVTEHKKAESQREAALEELKKLKDELELKVVERTKEIQDKVNELDKSQEAMLFMVEDLNKTSENLRNAQEELLIKERLAVLGQFSGSISHELRNPLGVIDSSVYYLKMMLKDSDEKTNQHLNRISASVENSTSIIQSLLNLTRMKKPLMSKEKLSDIVSSSITSTKIPETIKVKKNFPKKEVIVNAESEQCRMAFKNIIINAVEAMKGKGKLTITIRDNKEKRSEVSFKDTGSGISPVDIEKVFQPLFSTKAKGIGFGLSIAKMIIENHKGTIRAESKEGKGAEFIVSLPLLKSKIKD